MLARGQTHPLSTRPLCATALGSGSAAACVGLGERRVVDQLPASFALARSESEWLLTLLSADEGRYIFEGPTHGESPD